MSFRRRILYLLVHQLQLDQGRAKEILLSGSLKLNGNPVHENALIQKYDEVSYQGKILYPPYPFRYFLYHKAKGIECSLSTHDPHTLGSILPEELTGLSYAGRLDKASEGLLLLSNDGHVIKGLTQPNKGIWKQYEVTLEQAVNHPLVEAFEKGMLLNGKMTLAAKCEVMGSHQLKISLQEGMNKQIRRMCFAAGNYVNRLVRTHIGDLSIEGLSIGEFRSLSPAETEYVKRINLF